ncbi:NAD+ kinase [Paragonimus westermani]|uniref:NAD(+) kinase n=1 Tax=Paragonimus westermani TaxID=34504 RepID=A0A5J4N9Q3_9TREM|nr:NAD+ kinase [Paragonimus westermani]
MTTHLMLTGVRFVYGNGGITIEWRTITRNILVVHKFCDEKVIDDTKILLTFVLQVSLLCKNWNASVFLGIETVNELRKDPLFVPMLDRYMCVNRNDRTPLHAADSPKRSSIIVFDCTRADDIDLIVCLGGDGTLLKIGSMFQRVVPPVIAFCLGTLGFLAPFSFNSFESILKHAIEGCLVTFSAFNLEVIRWRLTCKATCWLNTVGLPKTGDERLQPLDLNPPPCGCWSNPVTAELNLRRRKMELMWQMWEMKC